MDEMRAERTSGPYALMTHARVVAASSRTDQLVSLRKANLNQNTQNGVYHPTHLSVRVYILNSGPTIWPTVAPGRASLLPGRPR